MGSFLADIIEDIATQHIPTLAEDTAFTRLYRINVILPHAPDEPCPMVIKSAPTMTNLLGLVEREFLAGGMVHSDHLMIHAGSLLHADGGFVKILETRDVLAEPGAWKVLVRTLAHRSPGGRFSELAAWGTGPLLKPEPIDVNIKVILLGDPALYAMLDAHDPDFAELFKVLADFETSIARNQQGVHCFAGFLAHLARHDGLPPLPGMRSSPLPSRGHASRPGATGSRRSSAIWRTSPGKRRSWHDGTAPRR